MNKSSSNQKYFDLILNTLKSKYPEYPDDLFKELKKTKNLTELTDIVKKFIARQIESGEEV